MGSSQLSTEQSTRSDQYERIHSLVEDFFEHVKQALEFRLPLHDYTSTHRAAITGDYGDAMVHAANLEAELEERLLSIMILKGHLDSEWDAHEGDVYQRVPMSQYKSSREKQLVAIHGNTELWDVRQRVHTAVELGRRAIERVYSLHGAASRAAGISMGPVH